METLFAYPPAFQWTGQLIGLALAVYAVFAWRLSGRFNLHRWAALGLVAIFLAYAPQFWVHQARLSAQALHWTDGFWWQPREREIRFSGVTGVCTTTEASGRTVNTVWRVAFKDGAQAPQELVLSELLRWNAAEIQAAMQRQGIVFHRCAERRMTSIQGPSRGPA